MKAYHFTGDIKKLIPNGWTFQKLYANNYKTYNKNDIIMFVISKMLIEITNVEQKYQANIIKFILDNKNKPNSFWQSKSKNNILFGDTLFSNWVLQSGIIMRDIEAIKNKVQWLCEFQKDNSITYLEDGYKINFNLVQDIIQLDSIKPLELLKVI